ncbi:hypothetical protein SCHPADRAFT_936933 [Schizopora paradoxa]|uniref:Uncharacterized protein n=1 Tax=Schizopora paradoxa TaxID=27342 RepID=A0A0H2S133_9AGAM|nr:hypothetical protein SCHPADRAFT_936933 [Schizopora paradoxa]
MLFLFLVAHALVLQALGKNDWSKACLNGTCSYDIEKGPTTMGGTIEISGSSSAISDITPAAGWFIQNCTSSTNSQTVKLICVDESKGCGHIFHDGAQETVVRLPDDCGSGPFVRVARHWVPDDQTIPSNVSLNLMRRDAIIPQVHMLQLDDDFAQGSGLHGNVSFEARAEGDMHIGPKQRKRQNGSGYDAEPVTIPTNSGYSLLNDELTCSDGDGNTEYNEIGGDLTLNSVTMTVSVNFVIRGTVVPPDITSLSFSAPTTGNIQGYVSLITSLQGSVSALGVELVNIEFPEFVIDGVMSISPSFAISSDSAGYVQKQTYFDAGTNFAINLDSLQFTYPSNSPPATVSITTPSSSYFASANPNENGNADFEFDIYFKIIAQVAAFTQNVELSVTLHDGVANEMDASPSSGNNEEVCFELENSLDLVVANSGPFFQVFIEANSLTLYSAETTILETCQIVALGPSPPANRKARSSVYSRDSVSCPAPEALSQTWLSYSGKYP